MLQSVAQCCRGLHNVAKYCTMLQSVAEGCTMLQSVAQCCKQHELFEGKLGKWKASNTDQQTGLYNKIKEKE